MFCFRCGFQIPDDAQFCSKCGTAQNNVNSQSINASDWSNEALDIYLSNLLTLECINSKLESKSSEMVNEIAYRESNNYQQNYYIYTDRNGNPHYLYLWFDGDNIKFAAMKNNGKFPDFRGYTADWRPIDYRNLAFASASEWLSVEENQEIFETIWKYCEVRIFSSTPAVKTNKDAKKLCSDLYIKFKETAPSIYANNAIEIINLKSTLKEIETEKDRAKKLLEQAYSANIIPQQFRNLYAIYYLCDFIKTSNESLSTALLHCDLDIIKQKLDQIIEQQKEIIINQAILQAQNEQVMKQNQQTLNHLASIECNTNRAAQYAQIAANNAEACAWIGLANYIKD